MGGLSTVLDRLQTLFGKGYLVAGFLPALVFFGASALLSLWVVPAGWAVVGRFLGLGIQDQGLGWLALVFGVAVFGFVLWTANPWLHQVLQGHGLPTWAQAPLRWLRRSSLNDLEAKLQAASNEQYEYGKVLVAGSDSWPKKLADALLKPLPNPPPPAPEIQRLRKSVCNLDIQGNLIPFEQAAALFAKVLEALRDSPPPPTPPAAGSHAPHPPSDLLTEFVRLAKHLLERAEAKEQRLSSQRAAEFPHLEASLQPTRMANAWSVDMDYSWFRYGMGLELFELHLQKLLVSDEPGAALISERQLKLGFAVSMTAVSGLLAMLWIPLLAQWLDFGLEGHLAFGAASALFLLATWVFYQVTRLASRSYGVALRSVVDLYRFELLRALHLEVPTDSDVEKELWKNLTSHAELLPLKPLTYHHKEVAVAPTRRPTSPPPSGLDLDR